MPNAEIRCTTKQDRFKQTRIHFEVFTELPYSSKLATKNGFKVGFEIVVDGEFLNSWHIENATLQISHVNNHSLRFLRNIFKECEGGLFDMDGDPMTLIKKNNFANTLVSVWRHAKGGQHDVFIHHEKRKLCLDEGRASNSTHLDIDAILTSQGFTFKSPEILQV
jgi:hypothetical protein